MPTSPPWAEQEYIEQANRKLAVSMDGERDDFVLLDRRRFRRIVNRVSELHLLAPEALDVNGAREAFKDARRACELLISDRLARRGWLRRVLGRLW